MIVQSRLDFWLSRSLRIRGCLLLDRLKLLKQVFVGVKVVIKVVVTQIFAARFSGGRGLRGALRNAEEIVEDGFMMRRSRRSPRDGRGMTSLFGWRRRRWSMKRSFRLYRRGFLRSLKRSRGGGNRSSLGILSGQLLRGFLRIRRRD